MNRRNCNKWINCIRWIVVSQLVCYLLPATGQTPDTSFSIAKTYVKELKQRPYIRIAQVDGRHIQTASDQVYHRIADRELRADIFYPADTDTWKSRPAVLMIHGGGWRSGDKSHNATIGLWLAKKGYVAVSVEYRLSGEAPYPAAVNDLKQALHWLRREGWSFGADTSRIAVLGCSAGGQLASLLGTLAPVNAVVNIDGLLAFDHPESEEGAAAAAWLGGDVQHARGTWREASALTHVSKETAPMLFLNSSIPRFHAGRDDLIAAMQQSGIAYEVHTFPDSPHTFWFFDPWFEPMMRHIDRFLRKFL